MVEKVFKTKGGDVTRTLTASEEDYFANKVKDIEVRQQILNQKWTTATDSQKIELLKRFICGEVV